MQGIIPVPLRPLAHPAIAVLFSIVSVAGGAPAQTRPITLADYTRQVGITSPALAPDGRSVVVVTSRANLTDNRFDRSLWLVDVATGAGKALTPGRYRVSQPRWSPDGSTLAFLDADTHGKTQLFLLPSGSGEARQLTTVTRSISSFAWRPDGRALGYIAAEEPPARTGEERHNRAFEVGNNGYLAEESPLSGHLWVVVVDSGAPRRVTSAAGSVAAEALSWSPDGRFVTIVRWPSAHSGAGVGGKLVVVDVTNGNERAVDEGPASLAGPLVSPDGRWIAYGRPFGAEPGFTPMGVWLTPMAGGERRNATLRLDRSMSGWEWLPSSDGLLIATPDGTHNRLWMQPANGAAAPIELGAVEATGSMAVARDGRIVFVGSEAARPSELYVIEQQGARPRRLTSINAPLDSLRYGRVEGFEWKGPDGFEQDGVLVYPPDYTPGQKYPLVLNIHGGPMGSSTEAYSAVAHLMAAQGWLVFMPNYRGSNNRGLAFQRAVVNDAGDGPGRDVMSGIAVLKARGIVDESRIAVSGWSYGGYMTAWLTSHFPGWRVAVAGAAVTDWFDWYTLADINVWSGYGLGGSPWLGKNEAGYRAQAPITYAHRIKTPTLILSNVYDPRVTVTQSYKLYHALKDNGTKVQFVAYPIPGHFPQDPIHQRDVYRRWIDWIAQHFNAPASAQTIGRERN